MCVSEVPFVYLSCFCIVFLSSIFTIEKVTHQTDVVSVTSKTLQIVKKDNEKIVSCSLSTRENVIKKIPYFRNEESQENVFYCP